MITDAHLHIGLNNWTEDTLIRYLDNHEIAKAWILTWEEEDPVAPEYYIPLDIDTVRKAFRNHPDRIVPFYAPDPGRKEWKESLTRHLDDGFAGCGELKVPYRWNDPVMLPLLDFINERKLPLIFHMERARKIFVPQKDAGADWLFKRLINERFNGRTAHLIHNLPRITGIVSRYLERREIDFPGYLLDFKELSAAANTYTDIRFIAHGPHAWNHFSTVSKEHLFFQKGRFMGPGKLWELLENHPNIFCDLSGLSGFNALSRSLPDTRNFLDKFH